MIYVVGTPRGSENPSTLACGSATLMKSRHMVEIRAPGSDVCYDFVFADLAAAEEKFVALQKAIDRGDRVFRMN